MSRRHDTDSSLRCSFCHKSQGVVGKLISSPSDYPRAYICNECIAVCSSILEDDKQPQEPEPGKPSLELHPLIDHPLASEFFAAAEEWIHRESLGGDGAAELAAVRELAIRMMRG